MNLIPESHTDLLTDESRAFAYLATIMSDGSPQLTPLWFNTEGEYILINSAKGRVKDKNMRVRERVALLITDPKEPFYRYLQIRGRVVEINEQGALEQINRLALKYNGEPWTPRPNEIRVTYKILPEHVFADA